MTFEAALPTILRHEGGYVDHPQDPGGATNYGITQETYDGWRGVPRVASRPVRLITQEEVRDIYLQRYWRPARCDDLPPRLRLPHFDCAVNCGVAQAAKILQRALGVADDSIIGPVTLAAARAQPPLELVDEMLFQRLRYYRAIALRKRPDGRDLRLFLPAWVGRLLDLRHEVRG